MLCVIYILMLTVQNISSVMNSVLLIIANYGFESATMVQRCYIRLFTLKICMNHINNQMSFDFILKEKFILGEPETEEQHANITRNLFG